MSLHQQSMAEVSCSQADNGLQRFVQRLLKIGLVLSQKPDYGNTAIGRQVCLAGVVTPRTVQDIVQVVQAAQAERVRVYPIGCGKNWGYGSSAPVSANSVVLDLAGMDQIQDFDDNLGVVTVGPGVSQQRLSEFLLAQGDRWLTPTSGAGPKASVLGNALERGYGLTPEADHFHAVQSLEVVLPDGRVLHSALRAAGAQRVDQLMRWGLGPYIEGLFTQSGMGVVTKATIGLARRPACVMTFLGKVSSEKALPDVVDATREALSVSSGLIGGINLMNQRRVLAMAERPSELQIKQGMPVSENELERLALKHGVAAWTVMGALYGEHGPVKETAKLLKSLFRKAGVRLICLGSARTAWLHTALGCVPGGLATSLKSQVGQLCRAQEILEGRPNEVALPLAYWRHPNPPQAALDAYANEGGDATGDGGLDPARDGCGLIWYSPLVPMTPEDVKIFVQTTTQTCLEFGIDPLITLTSLSHRCFDCTIPLLFNAKDASARKRAQACYEALFDRNIQDGYVPYRLPISQMHRMVDPEHVFWQVASELKKAVDPGGIMSPGRYGLVPNQDGLLKKNAA